MKKAKFALGIIGISGIASIFLNWPFLSPKYPSQPTTITNNIYDKVKPQLSTISIKYAPAFPSDKTMLAAKEN